MKKEKIEFIAQCLVEQGILKYGCEISKEILGKFFECNEYNTGEYIYPLLELKGYVEQEMGMFCKTHHGNLCIGMADVAPEYLRKRRRKGDNLDKRTRNILENINYRNMSAGARSEAMLERRMLEMKLRHSRLIIREIEYYEVQDEDEEE